MKTRTKKGQSTLEYIVLVTAVVAVAIVFLKPQQGGKLYDTINSSYTTVVNGINKAGNNLVEKWQEWN